ncbi:MAG: reverse transcriptase domain-containing protein [Sphingomonadales bacterium]
MNKYPKPRRHFSEKQLLEAWSKSRDSRASAKSPGVDGITPQDFRSNLNHNLAHLSRQLCAGAFRFSPLRPIAIEKKSGNYRIIFIPTVQDRLVQRRICEWLSSGDVLGVENRVSYGFRSGLGVGKAVKKARDIRRTHPFVMKSDISSFFDEIDRSILINKIEKKLGKNSLIPFIRSSIECEIDIKDEFIKIAIATTNINSRQGSKAGNAHLANSVKFRAQRF